MKQQYQEQPQEVDQRIFARRLIATLGQVVDACADKSRADQKLADAEAELTRVFGPSAARSIVSVLTERRYVCPQCCKDTAESEMRRGLCIPCFVDLDAA